MLEDRNLKNWNSSQYLRLMNWPSIYKVRFILLRNAEFFLIQHSAAEWTVSHESMRIPHLNTAFRTLHCGFRIQDFALRIADCCVLSVSSCGTKKVKIISTFKNATESHPKRSLMRNSHIHMKNLQWGIWNTENVAIFDIFGNFPRIFRGNLVQIYSERSGDL